MEEISLTSHEILNLECNLRLNICEMLNEILYDIFRATFPYFCDNSKNFFKRIMHSNVALKMDILDNRRKFERLIQITERCRFHMQITFAIVFEER